MGGWSARLDFIKVNFFAQPPSLSSVFEGCAVKLSIEAPHKKKKKLINASKSRKRANYQPMKDVQQQLLHQLNLVFVVLARKTLTPVGISVMFM